MAKWGEGDPRWLVQDRCDGHNVNGWHWTEKSYTKWSRARIEDQLVGLAATIDPVEGSASIVGLKHMEGEVSVNIRKGNKRSVIYDITLTMTWNGQMLIVPAAEPQTVSGEIRVAEFANDLESDDYLFEVTVEGQGQAHDWLRSKVRKMRDPILAKLQQILEELHQG